MRDAGKSGHVIARLVRAPRIDFSGLRRELELPTQFPLAAQREADAASDRLAAAADERQTGRRSDRTDIPFVTVDPPASRDLDQAMSLSRRSTGYRIHYAVADVTAFVNPRGALADETWRRALTVYLPDGNVPLHPRSLSEDAASLLPDRTRPAVLWTVDVDSDGEPTSVTVERALIRSRAKLDYATVQSGAVTGSLVEPIEPLPELGRLLLQRAVSRGAISLPMPEQEVRPEGDGWRLVLRSRVPAEEWNAQISLLIGGCAARIMLEGHIGLLRTMPAPDDVALRRLRSAADALGVPWPEGQEIGAVLATVDTGSPSGAAFLDMAAELMRGAGYTAFDGDEPELSHHGGVGGAYAHVTAPLRRLADRYAAEVCLSLVAGREVPDWVRTALPKLPAAMAAAERRASNAERAAIDLAEATLLQGRVGEVFEAAVVDVDESRGNQGRAGGWIALSEPPVLARCWGLLPLGERIPVRLVTADPRRRQVEFTATD